MRACTFVARLHQRLRRCLSPFATGRLGHRVLSPATAGLMPSCCCACVRDAPVSNRAAQLIQTERRAARQARLLQGPQQAVELRQRQLELQLLRRAARKELQSDETRGVRGRVPRLSLLRCSFRFSCTNELPTASTSSVAAVTPNWRKRAAREARRSDSLQCLSRTFQSRPTSRVSSAAMQSVARRWRGVRVRVRVRRVRAECAQCGVRSNPVSTT